KPIYPRMHSKHRKESRLKTKHWMRVLNDLILKILYMMGHIDLRGRAHFDKITQTDIPTPHVQTSPINIAPNGKRFPLKKQEVARPATKQDIRTARELAKKQGILK
ncbi:hypothetical protein, partial [Photorhabdus africana]|uniref:hypothetical protein n=1 Tax=Photorhabdus africana TaxID=3097554 RepID=UPI002B4175AE